MKKSEKIINWVKMEPQHDFEMEIFRYSQYFVRLGDLFMISKLQEINGRTLM